MKTLPRIAIAETTGLVFVNDAQTRSGKS